MPKIKLKFKRDHVSCFNDVYKKGQVIDYRPWSFEWGGMTESERVTKDIFVHCYGMGEFDVFYEDDVTPYFLEEMGKSN
jgi:hypothetical protein